MSIYSELLFARPSFVEGIARLLDFGGALQQYNSSLTPNEADYMAVASDWRAISDDLSRVLEEARRELTDNPGELLLEQAARALDLDAHGPVADRE